MKKRIIYLGVLLLVAGISFAIATYNFPIPNPGHGGETGVWIENHGGTEKYLQDSIDINELSTLNCPDNIHSNSPFNLPSNFVGHDAEHISVIIKGVQTTLQEAINNQWLAKYSLSNPCSLNPPIKTIPGASHPASQIVITSPKGGDESLQKSIDDGDFFDNCDCTPPVTSIWTGWRTDTNRESRLVKITSEGNILEQYTICKNPTTLVYSSISGTTSLSQCPGVTSGPGRFGVGYELPSTTDGAHNGFVAYNSVNKEVWYIIGSGVAHFKETPGGSPSLSLTKYCTQPNGIYSVTLDANGNAWITSQQSDLLKIMKISGGSSTNCNPTYTVPDPSTIMRNIFPPDSGAARLAFNPNKDIWATYVRNDGISLRLFYIRNPETPSVSIEDLTPILNIEATFLNLITDKQGNAYATGRKKSTTTYSVNKYTPDSSHIQSEMFNINEFTRGLAINPSQNIWVARMGLTRISPLLNIPPPTIICQTITPKLSQVGIHESGDVWGIATNGICVYDSNGNQKNCFCSPLTTGQLVGEGDFTGTNRKVSLGLS